MIHFRRWSVVYLLVITGLAPLYAAQWKSQDIGSVSVAGSATIGSDSYTVTGDGDDIWNTADAFHFLYLPMSGDGEIVARVASLQGNNNDGGWSKAGVMFRETLNASSTHASVDITSGNGADFQWRGSTGGGSSNAGADGVSSAPRWVRLVRQGNLFTGYKSNDGINWTQNGSVSIAMAADIYVGLCVTAHASGNLSTATFDHVSGNAVVNPWKPVLVSPANNADNIPLDGVNLRWGPPEVVPPLPIIRYDLYATENRAELENPDLSAPAFIASILPNQPLEYFSGTLDSDKTYYWRVDTVITGETMANGEIWAFQTIRRLPQFLSQPVTQAVHPGARVEFSALASSDYGAVSYTWFKQPNPAVLSTASSLVLTNVTSADNGFYVCRATNSIGSTDSNPARLIVLDRGALQAGLEAYWPLDDSLADASGSAHDGTLVGSATSVDGIIGKGLLFPGTAGNAVQTGTWNPSAMTGKLSFSIWAKWNGINGNYHGLIAKRDAWDPAQMMWQLEIDASSGLSQFSRYGQTPDPGVVLPVGLWHHIAVSFDGTTARIYHDGQLTSSGDFSFGTGTASQLVFGCGEAGGNNPFNGVLDEVAVWNRDLSADEVAYLFNNGKGNPIFEPVVTISETAGATVVAETGASDTFTLQLAKQPMATVSITVTPASDDLELNGGFPGESVALSFDTTNWNLPQTVTVRATVDTLEEGDETVRIGFGIESADPEFHHAFIPFVQVRVIDAVEPICPTGDLDGDCQVNLIDLLLFTSDWLLNKQCTDGSCGELTGTGWVNLEDMAIVAENWLDGRGPVVISEFMAANHSQAPLQAGDLLDEDSQSSDWIELYNLARIPMNIGGWYLTNDARDLKKWRIPDGVSINGGTPQVIFASGKNRAVAGSELHTNFALDQAGSYLALVASDGKTVIHEYATTELDNGAMGYPPQEPQISYGLFDFFRKERYFQPATPGERNRSGVNGLVADTKFSVDRGFFTQPFDLELSTVTPGATIRYTLDGSAPSLGRGEAYVAGQSIHIARTTVIRAAAFLAGWISSNVDTQTYLFLTDVLQQSPIGEAPGAGWPTTPINGQVFDYGMDPDVINDARYKDQMATSLKSIPTMSLVTDLPNLFDPTIGIYVNADSSRYDGIRWEKPASLELINPDGTKGFQINCGLRIRGGYSRGGWNPKHAFRVFFRSEYGDAKLKYPLFESEGVDTFDKVDLRCSQNYSWAHGGDSRNTNVRDEFSRDVQSQMGDPYTRTRYYHLYINGSIGACTRRRNGRKTVSRPATWATAPRITIR